MALEMRLELEGNPPDWFAVEKALAQTGVENLESLRAGPLDTYFRNSGAWITPFHWQHGPRDEVSAEGVHGCKFVVAGGLTFRLAHITTDGSDDGEQDIKTFLTHLTDLSPMQFVLSFQGEGVYATRCGKRGFEWFWHAPRDANWQAPALPAVDVPSTSSDSASRTSWLGRIFKR